MTESSETNKESENHTEYLDIQYFLDQFSLLYNVSKKNNCKVKDTFTIKKQETLVELTKTNIRPLIDIKSNLLKGKKFRIGNQILSDVATYELLLNVLAVRAYTGFSQSKGDIEMRLYHTLLADLELKGIDSHFYQITYVQSFKQPINYCLLNKYIRAGSSHKHL